MIATGSAKGLAAVCAAACLAILLPSAFTHAQAKPAGQSQVQAKGIERGKYLVTIMACNECHTPLKMGPKGPEPDMSRMLSGHPEQIKLPPPPKVEMPWMGTFNATDTAF